MVFKDNIDILNILEYKNVIKNKRPLNKPYFHKKVPTVFDKTN